MASKPASPHAGAKNPSVQERRRQLAESFRNPIVWMFGAFQLWHSAQTLLDAYIDVLANLDKHKYGIRKVYIGRQYLMLSGFTIENLLKGVAVHKNPAAEYLTAGELDASKSKKITVHPLRELAAHAVVPLSIEEGSLLDALTEFTVWAGRYTMPSVKALTSPRQGLQFNSRMYEVWPWAELQMHQRHSDIVAMIERLCALLPRGSEVYKATFFPPADRK